MLLVDSFVLIFDLMFKPQVLYSLEGLLDELSLNIHFIYMTKKASDLSRHRLMSLPVQ